jgi:hypothetical protein
LAIQKRYGYSEGVKQNDAHDSLYNAFSVNDGFLILSQGAPLDKLAATLATVFNRFAVCEMLPPS